MTFPIMIPMSLLVIAKIFGYMVKRVQMQNINRI